MRQVDDGEPAAGGEEEDGLPTVGITMPKSSALPSNLGWTVKLSCFLTVSQVMNTFCAGCRMSAFFAEK